MFKLNPIFHWAKAQNPSIELILQFLPPEYGKLIEFYTGAEHLFLTIQSSNLILNDLDGSVMSTYKLINCQIFSVHYKELSALINPKDFIFIDQTRSYFTSKQDDLELLAFLKSTQAKWFIFQPSTLGYF